jgi:H+/Cl- antiporter ClcA
MAGASLDLNKASEQFDVTVKPKELEAETTSRLAKEAKELEHKHAMELGEFRQIQVLDYVVIAFLGIACIGCGVFIFRFHSEPESVRAAWGIVGASLSAVVGYIAGRKRK